MLKSYFRVAWRILIHDLQFTVLSLSSLTIGLVCAFLIYLWVADEQAVDKFNKGDDRVYQVMKNSADVNSSIITSEYTSALMAQSMATDFPEIEHAVSVIQRDKGILSVSEKHIKAKHIFAGADFFNVFSFWLIQGNAANILKRKDAVLISRIMAEKLFSDPENAVGKTVSWDWWTNMSGVYVVAGIFEIPSSSVTLQADIMFSHTLWVENNKDTYWGTSNAYTYIRLKKDVNVKQFNAKIKNYSKEKYQALYGTKGLQWEGSLFLQRYSDKYLHNHYENGVVAGGRIAYVRLFSLISVFVLAIAIINFMNLATAKFSRRAKETGIRKLAGAKRYALILQYLSESVLISFLCLLIAVILVLLLLPQFNYITGKTMTIASGSNFILPALGITLVTGIIAGSYPSIYLSSFKPATILKGSFKTSATALITRKGLVIFQFTLSTLFVIGMLVIYKQFSMIQTKNLGYQREHVIRFANEGKLSKQLQPFLAEARKIPGVINASGLSGDLTGHHGGGGGIDWPGKQPGQDVQFGGLYVDFGLIETLGIKMAEGRPFLPQFGTDSSGVIFNETAIAAMHLKNPVGQTVVLWGEQKHIIGVVKDFHFESFYKTIGPFFFSFTPHSPYTVISIKAGKEKETLAQLTELYKAYNPGLPFEYKFLDEEFQALYSSENVVLTLSKYFTVITLSLSCLGLLGLGAFMAQKRSKEIGIRKVVGASTTTITLMLSADFLKLVLVALAIACPIAWWSTHEWLQSFAYRINPGIGVFLSAGIGVVLITLLSISFQVIRAAIANPVVSLRNQ